MLFKFFDKKLKRKKLLSIIEEWKSEYKNKIDSNSYLKLLNKLEEEINKHLYESDYRFTTYGRRDFIFQEFLDILNDKVNTGPINKFASAFVNLEEYIHGWNHIGGISDIPKTEKRTIHEIDKQEFEYYKSGIVCDEEKNVLLKMINEFKANL